MDRPDAASLARALRAVLEAFPEDARPPDEIAVGGRWFDEAGAVHSYQDPESDEVGRFFRARKWTEIGSDELLGWGLVGVSTTFLTPAARAYYLPAYLKAILAASPDADWVSALDVTAWDLVPPSPVPPVTRAGGVRAEPQRKAMSETRRERFEQFVDAMTDSQKAALATFLQVFEPSFIDPDMENSITSALDAYWRRYCPR